MSEKIREVQSSDEKEIILLYKTYVEKIGQARKLEEILDFAVAHATDEHKKRVRKGRAKCAKLSAEDYEHTLMLEKLMVPVFSESEFVVQVNADCAKLFITSLNQWKGYVEFRKVERAWKFDGGLVWDRMPHLE